MPYNRTGALSYVTRFWEKVCHDGRVGSNWKDEVRATKRQQKKIALFASSPAGGLLRDVSYPPDQQEDDCTHFISCCIGFQGSSQNLAGGGLPIGQQYQGGNPFGFDNPDGLLGDLIGKHLAVKVVTPPYLNVNDPNTPNVIATQLTVGDLLAYADASFTYQHMAIIVEIRTDPTSGVATPRIACHTHSRQNDAFTVVGWPNVQMIRIR